MEQYLSRQAPPSDRPPDSEVVYHNTRNKQRNVPSDFDNPNQISTPNQHHIPSNLPRDQMKKAMINMNQNQQRKKLGASNGSPFDRSLGRDTMNKPKTRHSNQEVNSSRQPLATSSNHASSSTDHAQTHHSKINMGLRQQNPLHIGMKYDASSTPHASSSRTRLPNQQTPYQQHNRRSSSIDQLISEEDDVQVINPPRRSDRNKSPHKHPSSHEHHMPNHHYSSRSRSPVPQTKVLTLKTSLKGKARLMAESDTPTKPSSKPPEYAPGGLTNFIKDTGRKDDDDVEPIQDPNGVYKVDSEIEVIGDEPKNASPNKRKTPTQNLMATIQQTIARESPPKPKTSRLARMQDRNGNLPLASNAAKIFPLRRPDPPLKSSNRTTEGTIASALRNRFTGTADIEVAFLGEYRLKCFTVRLTGDAIQIILPSGANAVLWNIAFDTILETQICSGGKCPFPFMMIRIGRIEGAAHDAIDTMLLQGENLDYTTYNYSEVAILCVCLRSQNEFAKDLIAAVVDKLQLHKVAIKFLNIESCSSLRKLCYEPIEAKELEHQRKRREKLASRKLPRRKVSEDDFNDVNDRPQEISPRSARRLLTKVNDNDDNQHGKSTSARGHRKSVPKDEDTPRPRKNFKDKQAADPTQSILNFPVAAEPTHDASSAAKDSTSGSVESDNEQREIPAKTRSKAPKLFQGDKNDLLFPFPPTGRADVNITVGDAQRVESGEFLNDTLLEFGLRRVLGELRDEIKNTVHLFNSFFYERLSDRSKKIDKETGHWPGYESVKKWSKGKDIFEKDFIVIPINEHFHWYLAVIYKPGRLIKPRNEGGEAMDRSHRPISRTIPSEDDKGDASRSTSDVDDVLMVSNSSGRFHGDLDDLDSVYGSRESSPLSEAPFEQNNKTPCHSNEDDDVVMDDSADPLDCIEDDDAKKGHELLKGKEDMKDVSDGVEKMEINSENGYTSDSVGQGAPLSTPTLDAFSQQNDNMRIPSPEPVEQPKKKPLSRPDAQILDSEHTWIITFDSLGGPHKAVSNQLNMWLKYEAKHKKNIDHELPDAMYWDGRAPAQDNFSDCGLYVVYYVQRLLQAPEQVLRFVERRPPFTSSKPERSIWEENLRQAWDFVEGTKLRDEWVAMMISLSENYKSNKAPEQDQLHIRDTAHQDEEQQIAINASQAESVAFLDPDETQIPATATTLVPSLPVPEDLIPGAFPTPTRPSTSRSASPQKVESKPTSSSGKSTPKWITHQDHNNEQKEKQSSHTTNLMSDYNAQRSTSSPNGNIRRSTSPDKSKTLPIRSFTNVPDGRQSSPGKDTIPNGTVVGRVTTFDPLNFNKKASSSHQLSPTRQSKHKESKEMQRRLEEIKHLIPPRRETMGDITESHIASTSNVEALGSSISGDEDIDMTLGHHSTPYNQMSSPLTNLGKFAPGHSRSEGSQIKPINSSPVRSNRQGKKPNLNDDENEGNQEEGAQIEVLTSDNISSTKLGPKNNNHQHQNSVSSEEEQETIEDLPPKEKHPPALPVKKTYARKLKVAQTDQTSSVFKRTRTSSGNGSNRITTKKAKTNNDNGKSREDAIAIDSDSEPEK
ncbi:uncharacterized protein L201_001870 [Kwoniella dendrophila CBS 6074]|uniref:Ubiquitin-like protease family profile domain-containing protein n=1 Tax=Kwoniella dendrophila CBS 6074 TaxID=1295534 RepID=A0AAX4JQ23_9TREE